MSSELFAATAQAAMFSALSSTLAQGFAVYQHNGQLSTIDPASFFNFLIIAIITTPLNYLYQRFLEQKFPSSSSSNKVSTSTATHIPAATPVEEGVDVKTKTQMTKSSSSEDQPQPQPLSSVVNTAAKWILDQSFGAAANTALFICLMGLLKGKGFAQIGNDLNNDFSTMLLSGYRVWPLVSLLNLAVVPFEHRMLVGNTAGVLWGVYVNLNNMM